MKKMWIPLLSIVIAQAVTPIADPFEELQLAQEPLVLHLDEQLRSVCDLIIDMYLWLGGDTQDDDLQQVRADVYKIECQPLLNLIRKCLHATWPENHVEAQIIKKELEEFYHGLQQEYDEALALSVIRSSRVKYIPKIFAQAINTNSLLVNYDLLVGRNLTVQSLGTGAVIANNGVVTTGPIPSSSIPNNAITTNKIAPGAVTNSKIGSGAITGDKLAANTITPTNLNFNVIFGSTVNLITYHGSINGADGAVINGVGFSASRTSAGIYRIAITAVPFQDITSYHVFVQPATTNFATVSILDANTFDVTITNGIIPLDSTFAFLALGVSSAPALKPLPGPEPVG